MWAHTFFAFIIPIEPCGCKRTIAMTVTSLIKDLQRKTEKLIAQDVSYFYCKEKELDSVVKVQIFIQQEPISGEKQKIPFNGKATLRFKEAEGGYSENHYDFSGQIEVENYSTLIGVVSKPFIIHINR